MQLFNLAFFFVHYIRAVPGFPVIYRLKDVCDPYSGIYSA
jgi:hypothetical protein